MKKFEFRLEKVLTYRRSLEKDAKDAYLECKRATTEVELQIQENDLRRRESLKLAAESVTSRISLQHNLEKFDDQERGHRAALSVLQDEEAKAMGHWQTRKQDVKALEKLRETALNEWRYSAEREEQGFLDEWATSRRLA